jgi:hypothetical protein
MEFLSDTKSQITLLTLVGLMSLPLAFWVQDTNTAGTRGPLVVLTLPWDDPAPAILAAGGAIVAPSRAPFGVVAASDDPQFATRLSALGYVSLRSSALSRLICGGLS